MTEQSEHPLPPSEPGHYPPFDAPRMGKLVGEHGHGKFLGFRYIGHGADWIELGLPWREELVGNPETGILASGPIISLMDTSTSMAVFTRRGTVRPQATLDLRIDYVRAATPGKMLIGRGECYQLKRSVAFVRGIAHEGDPLDPVAHATGVFMFTDG